MGCMRVRTVRERVAWRPIARERVLCMADWHKFVGSYMLERFSHVYCIDHIYWKLKATITTNSH